MCLCVIYVKAGEHLLYVYMGVREQPPMLIRAFHLVWGWVSLSFAPACRTPAVPQASGDSPISTSHLVSGSLVLQMCSVWFLVIQTEVLTLACHLLYALNHLPSPHLDL